MENDYNFSKMNVNISNILLTPLACASLVNEILKGILYQKSQIPYPYHWMKTMVTKKRQKTDDEVNNHKNIKASNHFLLVSSVYDRLESAMQGIINAFSQLKSDIIEVAVVLGTTPSTAKEVFTICFSSLVEGHIERNHVSQLNAYQHKILRSIFLSQDWLDKIDASVACTNVYIYIAKRGDNSEETPDINGFTPIPPLTFSTKTAHMKISLISERPPDLNCCDYLTVFEENRVKSSNSSKKCDNEDTEDITWYKFKDLVKGFKDCFVDKMSVSESW